MNQDRFDELAKGLANNRFSRKQVLKGILAGNANGRLLDAVWGRMR